MPRRYASPAVTAARHGFMRQFLLFFYKNENAAEFPLSAKASNFVRRYQKCLLSRS